MKTNEVVQLDVQLDASNLQIGTEELANICESVNQSLATIAQWAMFLPGTATGNRWTHLSIKIYQKPLTFVRGFLYVGITYFHGQSPGNYRRRMCA